MDDRKRRQTAHDIIQEQFSQMKRSSINKRMGLDGSHGQMLQMKPVSDYYRPSDVRVILTEGFETPVDVGITSILGLNTYFPDYHKVFESIDLDVYDIKDESVAWISILKLLDIHVVDENYNLLIKPRGGVCVVPRNRPGVRRGCLPESSKVMKDKESIRQSLTQSLKNGDRSSGSDNTGNVQENNYSSSKSSSKQKREDDYRKSENNSDSSSSRIDRVHDMPIQLLEKMKSRRRNDPFDRSRDTDIQGDGNKDRISSLFESIQLSGHESLTRKSGSQNDDNKNSSTIMKARVSSPMISMDGFESAFSIMSSGSPSQALSSSSHTSSRSVKDDSSQYDDRNNHEDVDKTHVVEHDIERRSSSNKEESRPRRDDINSGTSHDPAPAARYDKDYYGTHGNHGSSSSSHHSANINKAPDFDVASMQHQIHSSHSDSSSFFGTKPFIIPESEVFDMRRESSTFSPHSDLLSADIKKKTRQLKSQYKSLKKIAQEQGVDISDIVVGEEDFIDNMPDLKDVIKEIEKMMSRHHEAGLWIDASKIVTSHLGTINDCTVKIPLVHESLIKSDEISAVVKERNDQIREYYIKELESTREGLVYDLTYRPEKSGFLPMLQTMAMHIFNKTVKRATDVVTGNKKGGEIGMASTAAHLLSIADTSNENQASTKYNESSSASHQQHSMPRKTRTSTPNAVPSSQRLPEKPKPSSSSSSSSSSDQTRANNASKTRHNNTEEILKVTSHNSKSDATSSSENGRESVSLKASSSSVVEQNGYSDEQQIGTTLTTQSSDNSKPQVVHSQPPSSNNREDEENKERIKRNVKKVFGSRQY